MSRGRKPIVLDKNEFQQLITKLETEQKFANRTQLWEAVELTSWAKSQQPRPLTGQVAMLKARELEISIQTPVGQRGRSKGSGPIPGGGRKKRVMDLESVALVKNSFSKEAQVKLAKTFERLANGSMKAAIKANCLDCVGELPGEVAKCEIKKCPMWNFRPYKRPSVVRELL